MKVVTIAEIAEETGRHYTTIARCLRRFEEEGEHGMPQRPSSGRPPRTSAEQDAAIVEVASLHLFMSLRDVATAAGVDNIHVQIFKPCRKVALSQEAAELTLLSHLSSLCVHRQRPPRTAKDTPLTRLGFQTARAEGEVHPTCAELVSTAGQR